MWSFKLQQCLLLAFLCFLWATTAEGGPKVPGTLQLAPGNQQQKTTESQKPPTDPPDDGDPGPQRTLYPNRDGKKTTVFSAAEATTVGATGNGNRPTSTDGPNRKTTRSGTETSTGQLSSAGSAESGFLLVLLFSFTVLKLRPEQDQKSQL